MRNVTAIEPEWLPVYVPGLCNLGELLVLLLLTVCKLNIGKICDL